MLSHYDISWMFLGQCNGLNNLFLSRRPGWDHFLLLEEEANTVEYFQLNDEMRPFEDKHFTLFKGF